jgi:hypothetical protein
MLAGLPRRTVAHPVPTAVASVWFVASITLGAPRDAGHIGDIMNVEFDLCPAPSQRWVDQFHRRLRDHEDAPAGVQHSTVSLVPAQVGLIFDARLADVGALVAWLEPLVVETTKICEEA